MLYNDACELNVVEHCNLSCRGCSHMSPTLRPKVMKPEHVLRDLTLLAAAYQVGHVRIVGGEPLLHPHLDEVVAAIRESGITSRVRLLTNGTKAERLRDIGPLLDEVHISAYPVAQLDELIDVARSLSAQGVHVEINKYDHFREPYADEPSEDATLTQRIFDTCQIAHVWRCHTVHGGWFYRCPQSLFLGATQRTDGSDRVRIDGRETLEAELRTFLTTEKPLAACRSCLGSVGQRFANVQVRRKDWAELQKGSLESKVDFTYLEILERDPGATAECTTLARF